uniref:Glycosyl transferase, family 2 n=1 Tax=Solibacter usitatus (strain Ellin6076) TaxID=234267 RepID=Q01XK9_SOLUE
MTPTSISIVIATRNRVAPLRATLETLRGQSLFPREVLIVDASDGEETRELIGSLAPDSPFPLTYTPSLIRSAARQRNAGADLASGEVLVFMDDDVLLDQRFLEELVGPFAADADGRLGGVSGTIINQTYTQPKGVNRLLLGLCLGNFDACWAGRLMGPAVNFLPRDTPGTVQQVDWLFSTGTAYRKDVFRRYRFGEQFTGYSFAEDVHLSARVGRDYRLSNTCRARFEHRDLGQHTHTDWVALGESMVINRRAIMVDILGRDGLADAVRLFAYEFLYCGLTMLVQARFRPRQLTKVGLILWGKLRGFVTAWTNHAMPTVRPGY